MKPRSRLGALALGVATFVGVLGLGVASMPGAGAEVEAETPAPAAALARVGKMNADANTMAAQRTRRDNPSAL